MRSAVAATLLAGAAMGLELQTAADPGLELLPYGAVDLTADGCVVLGPAGVRQQNGISTAILPEFTVSAPWELYGIALSADASALLGGHHDFGTGLYRSAGLPVFDVPEPKSCRGLSDDGRSVVGGGLGGVDTAFHWRDGSLQTLQPLPAPTPGASAEAVSADGAIVAGWSTDASGRVEAVVWTSPGDPPQPLGFLPGHTESRVYALSADGLVAVGSSGSASDARAFRWDGITLADLGPLTQVAHAVSADGAIVVGSGPQGAFVWDSAHGARRLADALLADHGLDVGDWRLDDATLVSGNGLTFAGEGRDPGGVPGTWRVRLDPAPCPPAPPVDLVRHQEASALFEQPAGLAVDSQRRVSVSAYVSRNVVRLDASLAQFPPSPTVEVMDLTQDGAPDDPSDVPFVLGVGPDDGVYVSAYARHQLWKIAPDGTRSLVFDGSAYPPLQAEPFGPLETSPLGLAIAPDGTLFVATLARLLRIDPDGSAHELLDAIEAWNIVYSWDGGAYPFMGVALQPGRVVVDDGTHVLTLSTSTGAALAVADATEHGLSQIAQLAPDDEGGVWVGGDGLAYLAPDGGMRDVFPYWADESVSGLPFLGLIRPAAGPDGSVFYSDGNVLVQRRGDGSWLRLLDVSTEDVFFAPLPGFAALRYADGVLYWVNDPTRFVGRYALQPPVAPACSNGVDDDGDGKIDYPADPGCRSRADDWEGSRLFACDDGLDDDGDGLIDYPADPGCAAPTSTTENPACSDGIDNDGDGLVDWDGAGVGPPDPDCGGDRLRVIEHPFYCGLGFEVAIVVLPLTQAARRWRRRRAAKA